MAEKKILLLGVGNILYSDEGLGVYAVKQMEAEYIFPESLTVLDGGTMGSLLMAHLMDHDVVVVLDAVLGGEAPGTVYRLTDDGLRKSLGFHDSQHNVDFVDTLIRCDILGKRPEAVVIGMEPADWKTMSAELTPVCKEKMPKFIGHVVEELHSLGVEVVKKDA
ncbi:HyaD/HybD family hydrogenase maturation endopeptidase [Desulfovibrio sp. OttesenSCG-928-G15]|nr:HyaD/HybD family hydrogenase maturation endopeptidase [Desulfovibrio sp. OttesenSCG-928-G15]